MKFRMAAAYAKRMMKDTVMKAEYWEKAKHLQLPNAYTAAITEYMRNPEIMDVDMKEYSGKENQNIKVEVGKKDFDIEEVEVAISDEDGKVVEKGKAIKSEVFVWQYTTRKSAKMTGKFKVELLVRQRTGLYYKATYNYRN